MEEQFWQTRWESGRIAFHEDAPNAFLVENSHVLGLDHSARIFLPLCGKARDLDWLLARGHDVIGIEFNRGAIEEVFHRLSLEPEIAQASGLTRFSHGKLTLWHGDFFALEKAALGHVDAVYDRAALVALPDDLRNAYAARLSELTSRAPQLLVSYDYDQSQTDGPPFSVPQETINRLYGSQYAIERLASGDITDPLAQRCSGQEQVWHLTAKAP
ncbi:MAG: thiopurine S-methyltransferase [Pseudomonadota bacterium]